MKIVRYTVSVAKYCQVLTIISFSIVDDDTKQPLISEDLTFFVRNDSLPT